MNNKKGFTLVEMLSVLSVLVIIFLIVIPEVSNLNKKSKENEYQRFLSDVFLSTEAYIQKNIDDYPNLNYQNRKVYVYFDELLESGYLKSTVKDPKNNKSVKEEDFTVQVFVDENNEYKYKLYEEHYNPLFISTVSQSLLDNNTEYGNYTYMGGTYLKGVQENNYVWYNGFLWRIMGINEDGTVRLITEENVTAIPYGASGQGLLYSTNEGYINDWLNKYFLSNLNQDNTYIIEESDWCLNPTSDSASVRTDCTAESTFPAKVGLITLDEYNLSGASNTNSTYYLANTQAYWTLTPKDTWCAWIVNYDGNLSGDYGVNNTYGVRPVINVSADAIITSGAGGLNDAYILNQEIDYKKGKLSENVSSGEYVSLNDKIYRVVSKEENGIKLIYDGYYEEITGTSYTMKYGNDNSFILSSGIGQKLNVDVLTWLGDSDKIIESNWYQTKDGFDYGTSYTTILDDKLEPISAKVGLIKVGEMLSGQSTSILTKNYTEISNHLNARTYWTLDKAPATSDAWNIGNSGSAGSSGITNIREIRPVIVVSNDTMISKGNGTLQSPYEIY